MSPRVINPGELAKGQHITVLDVIESEKRFAQDSDTLVMVGGAQPPDWRGTPFEVLAVDLPFVLLRTAGDLRTSFDTRRYQFMEITPEFWQACSDNTHPQFESLVDAHNRLTVAHRAVAQALQNHEDRLQQMENKPATPAAPPSPPAKWWKFW